MILETLIQALFSEKSYPKIKQCSFQKLVKKLCSNVHHYNTSSFTKNRLHKKSFRTNTFGKFSITVSVIDSWNKMQSKVGEIALEDLRQRKIKLLLTDKLIKSY